MEDFDAEILKVLYKDEGYKAGKIAASLSDKLIFQIKKRWSDYILREKSAMVRFIYLRAIDVLWTEHLVTIEHLQDSVRLRGYSQKDPLTEFKEEGLRIFIELLQEVDREIARTVFKIKPDMVPQGIMEQVATEENVEEEDKFINEGYK